MLATASAQVCVPLGHSSLIIFISPIGSLKLREKRKEKQQKQKKQNLKNLN